MGENTCGLSSRRGANNPVYVAQMTHLVEAVARIPTLVSQTRAQCSLFPSFTKTGYGQVFTN